MSHDLRAAGERALGVGRPAPERNADCEDQGFSRVSEGCNNWPCYRTPLVNWRLGWRCPKCGGCY